MLHGGRLSTAHHTLKKQPIYHLALSFVDQWMPILLNQWTRGRLPQRSDASRECRRLLVLRRCHWRKSHYRRLSSNPRHPHCQQTRELLLLTVFRRPIPMTTLLQYIRTLWQQPH